MKARIGVMGFLVVLAVLWSSPAMSLDPLPPTHPNGFISGAHYNLNIIGKKDGFVCPEPTYVDGKLVYGNVIFIPEYGTGISVYMQSGKATRFVLPELQVTDPCTFDDGKATLQLPKALKGYWVFARTLAKPGTAESPREMYIHPSIDTVVDELGNELWYMGTLKPDGTVCENGATPGEITCSLTRAKGKSTAVNITGIFDWTGAVCYFSTTGLTTYTEKSLCCSQADTDADGVLEYVGCYESVPDGIGGLMCPTGGSLTTTYCSSYADEWAFNIADFVQYLWSVDNSGSKLVQVRFYPIP
jgi:hypothetical protein